MAKKIKVEDNLGTQAELVVADTPVASANATESDTKQEEVSTNTEVSLEVNVAQDAPQLATEVVAESQEVPFVRDVSELDEIDKLIDLYVNVPMVPELRAILKKAIVSHPERLLQLAQYVNYGIGGVELDNVISLNI